MAGDSIHKKLRPGSLAAAFVFLLLVLAGTEASALNVNVTGPGGEAVAGFKWVIEEDRTFQVTPNVQDPATQAVRFHTSYMPVVATGVETDLAGVVLDPDKHYYISVLPSAGYSIGGAPIKPGQETVSVVVNSNPIPTAQISIFIFEDNQPINNAPDLPAEQGLEGFSIILEDAAGKYGMAGGQVLMDAFGNPLGTTYNADGSVAVMGTGIITTGPDGTATIKNLAPGKYGVLAVPPVGQEWVQTTTIEGSKVIDAWVKANEPPFFTEFGPPGWHVFTGFVRPTNDTTVLNGGSSISGTVVNQHLSRPPDYAFYNGTPFGHTTPMIGLNSLAVAGGNGVYAQPANADGTFSIPNVPPGDYQLVVWDENLDIIISLLGVTVPADGSPVVLGDVPVFNWFGRFETSVFLDKNENGFRDCVTPDCNDPSLDDVGIPEMAVNLRFRDGTIYKSFPTDLDGYAPFDEVFPFFSWLVAEVDFARLKATGATRIVDDGGPINPDQGWDYPSRGVLTPQPQFDGLGNPLINPNTGNNLSVTETGPVLTYGIQTFLGQTNIIEWGKAPYGPGENGGISGIVYYAVTRAEDDPAYAAAEEWEPGIPRVQVNLYADGDVDRAPLGWRDGTGLKGPEDIDWDGDGVFDAPDKAIDDVDGDGGVTAADVDNHPFGWIAGGLKGPEDEDWNGNGVFDAGDAIQITTTDSWDDSAPTGCQGEVFVHQGVPTGCYDGLRNFNQVRPGVFDGGYAFTSYVTGGVVSGGAEVEGLPSGGYIVEAALPPGYEHLKEQSKNVDFGDTYMPSPLLLPPDCVGEGHVVPAELTLFPGTPAPYAGQTRALCDRKHMTLTQGKNAAVDFFMFTEAPISAHIRGFILDDLSNEFDPTSPQFGEKYAPPWMPVSIRDWTGREISRVYSDEHGVFNALVPSTYTMNLAMPSGASPNMLVTCMNDPGPIEDPNNPGSLITDPNFDRRYSQFCYTFQYMPGSTTYLDTPVVPVSAFAGDNQYSLDCEYGEGTPRIYSVSGPVGGPYVASTGQSITIVSMGTVAVPNPLYDGLGGVNPKLVDRDYGFGAVEGAVTVNGTPLAIISWTADSITATVPEGITTGQLEVVRGDNGAETVEGVTLTVGPTSGAVRTVAPGGSIQDAIDTANAGDTILVAPGTYYEHVVLWKPVRLQGWGSGSTFINAANVPGERLAAWRQKVESLVATGSVDLLPAQQALFTEEGTGITVLAKDAGINQGGYGLAKDGLSNAWVDGVTITGSAGGGGVFLNGFVHDFTVANTRVVSNQGFFGGGIRSGHPNLVYDTNQGTGHQSAFNDGLRVHDNHINQNGGLGGAGGGISLNTGTDGYLVEHNYICGNFTQGDGGGVGHLGLSDNGVIRENVIIFNQSFNQGNPVSGGGIFIGGKAPVGDANVSPGSGNVTIDSNTIKGNLAGAGDGGAIRTAMVNGEDVDRNGNQPRNWYGINVLNNMITNNVAGLAGGAISMQDTAKINIMHNTIANNDSTGTAGLAFSPGFPSQSNPQPAGIVGRAHSEALAAEFGNNRQVDPYREFSNPALDNNVIWHNRSFYFVVDDTQDPPFYGLLPDVVNGEAPVYWDLWVMGTATQRYLNPRYSVLTDTTGYDATNMAADPAFVSEYVNGARNQVIVPEITTAIQAVPAFDEGGNFIDVRFGPLTPTGDHHIQAGSPAVDAGSSDLDRGYPELSDDYDGEPRPFGAGMDMGADEIN